jgi:thiosulfate/3-mercaptopyruvate sulfurtransferase
VKFEKETIMNIPAVVTHEWYRDHAQDVVLVDVRWYSDGRDGRAAYELKHIAGAIWVDLDHDLSAPAVPGGARHPVPTAEQFAAALGRRGIGDDAVVVAYDDSNGSCAARLVWLLRVLGQPAAILNGGVSKWTGAFDRGDRPGVPTTRTVRQWPEDRFVDPAAIGTLSAEYDLLLDARARDRYTGESSSTLDPRRGHIPGAINFPWSDNLDGDGWFLDPKQLRDVYARCGVQNNSRVAVYCGSGVTACADLLALDLLGVAGARLYPGSWSEWGANEDWPMDTGS